MPAVSANNAQPQTTPCQLSRSLLQLTVRFDMGAFCDPMVRRMYADENGSKQMQALQAFPREISYLSDRTVAIILDATLKF